MSYVREVQYGSYLRKPGQLFEQLILTLLLRLCFAYFEPVDEKVHEDGVAKFSQAEPPGKSIFDIFDILLAWGVEFALALFGCRYA